MKKSIHFTTWITFVISIVILVLHIENFLARIFRYTNDEASRRPLKYKEGLLLFGNETFTELNPVESIKRNISIYHNEDLLELQTDLAQLNLEAKVKKQGSLDDRKPLPTEDNRIMELSSNQINVGVRPGMKLQAVPSPSESKDRTPPLYRQLFSDSNSPNIQAPGSSAELPDRNFMERESAPLFGNSLGVPGNPNPQSSQKRELFQAPNPLQFSFKMPKSPSKP